MNEFKNNSALLFFWGFVLVLTALRIYFFEPFEVPYNSHVKLETKIQNISKSEKYYRIKIANLNVYAQLYPELVPGDKILVEGVVDDKGRMFDPDIVITGHEDGIQSYLWRARSTIAGKIDSLLPPREATLVIGTLLGIDTIGQDFREELVKTGTIHVVVVSGQNLAIVAGIFLSFVKYFGRRVSMLLATLACFFYALLVGFEPPVVRAMIMVFVSLLALYFGRATSALISVFAAAILIVLIWPDSIWSVSFQLTFAATLGIVTLGSKLQKLFKVPVIGEISSVCIGAFVFTAPLILINFGKISMLSPIVNIIVSEAIFPVMVLGFITAVLSLIFMPAAQIFAYLTYVPAKFFVETVGVFSKIDFGTIESFQANLLILALLGIFILGSFLIWRKI